MDGANLKFTGEKGQNFWINLKQIYSAIDMIGHCKINFEYDDMRAREKRKIDTLVFNFTAHIPGVLTFDFFFYRLQVNQPGRDDYQNNQHAQENSGKADE